MNDWRSLKVSQEQEKSLRSVKHQVLMQEILTQAKQWAKQEQVKQLEALLAVHL